MVLCAAQKKYRGVLKSEKNLWLETFEKNQAPFENQSWVRPLLPLLPNSENFVVLLMIYSCLF